jgi:hypothetical protein
LALFEFTFFPKLTQGRKNHVMKQICGLFAQHRLPMLDTTSDSNAKNQAKKKAS